MAGDTNRISNMVSGLYMLYSAPLAIGVCCTFLYSSVEALEMRSCRNDAF